MKTRVLVMLVAVVAFATAQMACMDREPAPVCPVPTELNQTEAQVGGFEGVDMLVMVDNSGSMSEEQAILATVFFPLINSLVNPLPTWQFPAADNVRVAVVSSDMGLSWNNQPYQDGDGWPGSLPAGCSSQGDWGQFQVYGTGKTVNIQNNVIPCGSGGAQCPTNWTCGLIDDQTGVGVCQAPGGDGTNQQCPALATGAWAETTVDVPNAGLAFQVSCLSALGTSGCGFEQQLQSAAFALNRGDQNGSNGPDFTREEALLAVLMVSDEEDCSIQSNQLFLVPEVQNQADKKVNIACNLDANEGYLFPTSNYFSTFRNAAGQQNGAVFAAIVGVPKVDACQGPGNEIGQCLSHPDMQKEPVIEQTAQGDTWFFKPACNRMEGDVEVTKARPGRRYVDLAQQFQNMGYVYSICNQDWSPAMQDIAELIAAQLAGTCYPKPLDWDPAAKQAKCDVVVEFNFDSEDDAECPSVFEATDPVIEEWKDADEVSHWRVWCPLPRLAAEKNCSDNDFNSGELADGFGWYYCENAENLAAENFDEACEDSLDNDNDGDYDCEDSECAPCPACGGNGMGCEKTCKYKVELTEAAKAEVQGMAIAVQCLQQFSFEDPNCQERSEASCNDDQDNDGNGIWDCTNLSIEDVQGDEKPHYADPNCCPMHVGDGNKCVVDEHGFCDGSSDSAPSDACRAHATLLGCEW